MKAQFGRVAAIVIRLATFILVIPSPSRGLPLVPVLLVMGLPLQILRRPVVNFLLLFSYPIGIAILLATSWGVVISWNRSRPVESRVLLVDVVILAVFAILGIALWM